MKDLDPFAAFCFLKIKEIKRLGVVGGQGKVLV